MAPKNGKKAWRERAYKLNSRPLPGMFADLPEEIKGDVIRQSVQCDSRNLHSWFKKQICKLENSKTVKATYFHAPQARKVGSLTYVKPIVLPELLKYLLFDNKEKFSRKLELVSIGRKGCVIIHIYLAR